MKKKLIAALTSAAMVATMVPATAFAAQASTSGSEAVIVTAATDESAAVTAFKDAVNKIPTSGDDYGYTTAYKSALDAAQAAYDALTSAEKDDANVKTQYSALTTAQKQYENWGTEVADVIDAIDKLYKWWGDFNCCNCL